MLPPEIQERIFHHLPPELQFKLPDLQLHFTGFLLDRQSCALILPGLAGSALHLLTVGGGGGGGGSVSECGVGEFLVQELFWDISLT